MRQGQSWKLATRRPESWGSHSEKQPNSPSRKIPDFMTEFNVTKADCEGPLHPMAVRGFELFNEGRYWHAHEALEEAWLEETGVVRNLYRGILQAGVVYLHVERANYPGMVKVYHRSRRWLDPFPDVCRGVQVGQLRRDVEAVFAEAERLGPEGLGEINRGMLKSLQYKSE